MKIIDAIFGTEFADDWGQDITWSNFQQVYWIIPKKSYTRGLEIALDDARNYIEDLHMQQARSGNQLYLADAKEITSQNIELNKKLGKALGDLETVKAELDYYKSKYNQFVAQDALRSDINAPAAVSFEEKKYRSKDGLSKIEKCKIAYTLYKRDHYTYEEISKYFNGAISVESVKKYIAEAQKHISLEYITFSELYPENNVREYVWVDGYKEHGWEEGEDKEKGIYNFYDRMSAAS